MGDSAYTMADSVGMADHLNQTLIVAVQTPPDRQTNFSGLGLRLHTPLHCSASHFECRAACTVMECCVAQVTDRTRSILISLKYSQLPNSAKHQANNIEHGSEECPTETESGPMAWRLRTNTQSISCPHDTQPRHHDYNGIVFTINKFTVKTKV